MRNDKIGKRGYGLIFALVIAAVLALGLSACGKPTISMPGSTTDTPAASPTDDASPTDIANPLDAQQPAEDKPYGKPWVTSAVQGNLPDAAPAAKDDLYLHFAYGYISAHQNGEPSAAMTDTEDELQDAIIATIKDTGFSTPEMDQLRIFYNQAADLNALEAAGTDELKPYLEAVRNTKTLDELKQLLVSGEFPFSPWLILEAGAKDMKSPMGVMVIPNMLFTDMIIPGDVYQEPKNSAEMFAYEAMVAEKKLNVTSDLMLLGETDIAKATAETEKIFDMEKSYGKDASYSTKYLNAEYGAQAGAIKSYTLDELQAACPGYPIKETLAKYGMDKAGSYIVEDPEWLGSFSALWTDANFERLRTMTTVKVLRECAPYISPTYYTDERKMVGLPEPTADEFAYKACDSPQTFGQLLAKTYAEQTLGEGAATRLAKLSNDLIDSYMALVESTPWLNEQSKDVIVDKLDNIALNVLAPENGYNDYGGLQLVPTDQGGTLLGNYLRVKEYNENISVGLIGQSARADSIWRLISPTFQNCFYEPVGNSINIFPGFVTSITYKDGTSEEDLLGGMGFVIGHEISHAFDYTGSQFNAYGEGVSVFTADDEREFVEKQQKLVDYYDTFEIKPGMMVDGTEKSEEAAADLCGMQVALERAKGIEGFGYEKFYEKMANVFADSYPSLLIDLLEVDVHAMSNARINASAQMFDEMYDTFGVGAGDGMYLAPEKRIVMWGKDAK